MKVKLFFLALVLLSTLAFPKLSFAHPIDELTDVKLYDQKHILEISEKKIALTIEMTFYALEKAKVWESIDLDKNKEISTSEKEIWIQKGKESSALLVEGERIDFEPKELSFPNYLSFFSSPPAGVTIYFEAQKGVKIGQSLAYFYQGKDKKLEDIELLAKGKDNLKVADIKKDTPTSALLFFSQGQDEGTVLGLGTKGRLADFLSKYVKGQEIPLSVKVLAFLVAAALGAIHAFTPGHGKAIVASYLVGARGTIFHALNLGLIVTITHTLSVFLLGILALLLTAYIVPGKVINTLNLFSGSLVLAFGLFLLFQRIKKLLRRPKANHEHQHQNLSLSWKNLLPLGISGGITPCVDALAILIVAISLGKILLGLSLLLSFSLGLSFALTSLGAVAVLARDVVQRRFGGLSRFEPYMAIFSAFVIIILGLALVFKLPI